MNRWYGIFVLILLLGAPWIWVSRELVDPALAEQNAEPVVGRTAPDFSLTTQRGESFTLSGLQGTPVVLNFWATWCGPCRAEMPELVRASDHYSPAIQIVGVNQGEPLATVQPFLDEFGITFAIPMDQEMTVGERYRITGLPTTFFIDRSGVIRRIWAGEMNGIILAEGISEILP